MASTEAILRATFEAQQAMLDAGLAIVAATPGGQAGALRQWAEAARSAQQAALETFLASLRAAWSIPPPASPAERPEAAEPLVEAYCLRCRTRRPMRDVQPTTVGGRPAVQGVCAVCGARVTRLTKAS